VITSRKHLIGPLGYFSDHRVKLSAGAGTQTP
jgi:hypothetical protein